MNKPYFVAWNEERLVSVGGIVFAENIEQAIKIIPNNTEILDTFYQEIKGSHRANELKPEPFIIQDDKKINEVEVKPCCMTCKHINLKIDDPDVHVDYCSKKYPIANNADYITDYYHMICDEYEKH